MTTDRRLGVVISDDVRERLLRYCTRAGRDETGGILIGRYSDLHDQAVITEVTGPPKDSIRRRLSFIRGFVGVQRHIDRAWYRHEYYLGEWHFHPFMDATPSDRDRTQITDFSQDPSYACPEPILIVVGGDPSNDPEFQLRLMQDESLVALFPSEDVDRVAPAQTDSHRHDSICD